MPILKLRMVRGFTLLAGVTRGQVPDPERTKEQARELSKARKRIKRQRRQIRHLQEKQEFTQPDSSGVSPENIVWIFGTARTGSTWLGSMMGARKGYWRWREPKMGHLLGYYFHRHGEKGILDSRYKEIWLRSIRSLVLGVAKAKLSSDVSKQEVEYLVVQEPNGSAGAPWLLEAFPESRLIFLVRDPRDVVASQLDAFKKGNWGYMFTIREGQQEWPDSLADTNPNAFVEDMANRYVRDIGYVKQAYDLHRGPKVLVRYEDLRADTLGTMKRMNSALELRVKEQEIARAVDKKAWESIPEDQKGEGKLRRKAMPGGWEEDLTLEQAGIVERITAPLLKEFYSS
jgi:Sulfotransferase family